MVFCVLKQTLAHFLEVVWENCIEFYWHKRIKKDIFLKMKKLQKIKNKLQNMIHLAKYGSLLFKFILVEYGLL